jgi:hypothetical protein
MPPLSTHLRVGDITVVTTLTDTLSPTATYKIVLLPMALLMPFGIDNNTKYVINKATVYILDTSITGGFSGRATSQGDSTQFDKFTRPTNNDGLGKVSALPILLLPHIRPSMGYRSTNLSLWCCQRQ